LPRLTHFSLNASHPRRYPHSFPTRRSSDLPVALGRQRLNPSLDRSGHRIKNKFRRPHNIGPVRELGTAPFTTGRERQDRRRCHRDRKSTRLNSSHVSISYAVFCLKKKINRI